ncbi:MAG: STAS/SEC14 domain-containing protein [Thermoanaerobaculia bacterium]|nr:STAS/SEC14 domain-containing protein [Thermoanaerobaculia bacterium]
MMAVETRGKILVLKMSGILKREHLDDAQHLVDEKLSEVEHARVLVDMRKYEGAEDFRTLWEEFRLVTANRNTVERIAVIGRLDWQKLATLIVSPFTRATEKFFEPEEMAEALEWLRE